MIVSETWPMQSCKCKILYLLQNSCKTLSYEVMIMFKRVRIHYFRNTTFTAAFNLILLPVRDVLVYLDIRTNRILVT